MLFFQSRWRATGWRTWTTACSTGWSSVVRAASSTPATTSSSSPAGGRAPASPTPCVLCENLSSSPLHYHYRLTDLGPIWSMLKTVQCQQGQSVGSLLWLSMGSQIPIPAPLIKYNLHAWHFNTLFQKVYEARQLTHAMSHSTFMLYFLSIFKKAVHLSLIINLFFFSAKLNKMYSCIRTRIYQESISVRSSGENVTRW